MKNQYSSWHKTEYNLSINQYLNLLNNICNKNLKSNTPNNSIKAMFVPHAGISYSGLCSATAYFNAANLSIKRIILLCTAHFGDSNVYTTNNDKFIIDKNIVECDIKIINSLIDSTNIHLNNEMFEKEHSFFNQLIFIGFYFPNAKIIPLIIGSSINHKLNSVINKLKSIITNDTIVMCTSDTSHINGHFDFRINSNIYNNIKNQDNLVAKFLNFLNVSQKELYSTSACGKYAIYLFIKLLNSLNIKLFPRTTCYYTSIQKRHINLLKFNKYDLVKDININSNTEGSVGYCSIIYSIQNYEEKNSNRTIENFFTEFEKIQLVEFSKNIVKYSLYNTLNLLSNPIISLSFLIHKGVFVTIKKNGKLRGCIGTTDSQRNTILDNVKIFSQQAAFNDGRFPPVTKMEINKLNFDVSILNEAKNISLQEYFSNKFSLDRDGILIDFKGKTGFFLPSVAIEHKYNKTQLVEQLCQNKIGVDKNCYKNGKIKYMEGLYF